MPLIGAEALAAAIVAFLSCAILSAYTVDWCGLAISPPLILIASIAGGAGTGMWLRRRAAADRAALAIFLAIVGVVFGALLWLSGRTLLPLGSGPDLVHHLALIDYIEQHSRLVHDVRLSEYLGEMVDYTPGFHLLAALIGAWIPRVDALHLVHPVVSFTVAVKAGIVYLVARRLMPPDVPRDAFAVAAVLLLLVPRVYSMGSFTEQSYLAQVASELFAVAAWWMATIWDERPARFAIAFFGLFAAVVFLVWPIWIGPLLILVGAIGTAHPERPLGARVREIGAAAASVAIVAAMHAANHAGGFRMAGTGGFAIAPTAAVIPPFFLALSIVAAASAAARRRTRMLTVFLAAIALQAAGLVWAARSSGAAAPYLAIKMFYLAIYPMAVAAAVLAADIWHVAGLRALPTRPGAAAWAVTIVVAIVAGRSVIAAPRPKPAVTEPVLEAALWAREHVPPACIDYLTRDGYTAYWLHLAVFGNPRASGRAMDDDTFEPKKAIVRWILPGGLLYAIADDFGALPRDIREHVDVLARFGPAAVVKRRGGQPSECP